MSGRKFDGGKSRYDLIPAECTAELAKILTFGAQKYDANNWQRLEDSESRYYAALMRHLEAHRMGEVRDPESGELHLSHVYTNACFLLWLEIQKQKKNVDKSEMDISSRDMLDFSNSRDNDICVDKNNNQTEK